MVGLHLALNSGSAQSWIRARVKNALLTRFEEVALGDRVSVDWIGRVTFGPLILADTTRPIFAANSVTIKPAYIPLLSGRLEPAAITFDKASVDLDRAKEAFEHLRENRRRRSSARDQPQERGPSEIGVRVERLDLQTERAGLQRALRAFGPLSGQFALRTSAAESRIEGMLRLNKGGDSTFEPHTSIKCSTRRTICPSRSRRGTSALSSL